MLPVTAVLVATCVTFKYLENMTFSTYNWSSMEDVNLNFHYNAISVTGMSPLSPYLNVDPRYLVQVS